MILNSNTIESSNQTDLNQLFHNTLNTSFYYKLSQQTYQCKIPLFRDDPANTMNSNNNNNSSSCGHCIRDNENNCNNSNSNNNSSNNTINNNDNSLNNKNISTSSISKSDTRIQFDCILHQGLLSHDWFPIISIQYHNIQLRPINPTSDLCDFLYLRRELSLINPSEDEGLKTSQNILNYYYKDRKSLQAIRWGITTTGYNYSNNSMNTNASSYTSNNDNNNNGHNNCNDNHTTNTNANANNNTNDNTNTNANNTNNSYNTNNSNISNNQNNNIIIGSVGFRFDKKNFKAEIDYSLLPCFWNKGIMKASLSASIYYLIKVMKLPLRTIEAHIDTKNHRSCSVLKKLGFVIKGQLNQNYYNQGIFHDTYIFQLVIPLSDGLKLNSK